MITLRNIYILLAALLTCQLQASAATSDELVSMADSAYVAKEYFKAIELYDSAMTVGGPSPTVYYNLGNAYYRVSQPGRAIVNYERCLRLDPTNRQARLNLDFVNTQTADKTTDSGSVMIQLANSITMSMKADTWAWVTLSLFIAALVLAAGYFFLSEVIVRKICFFGGIIALITTIVSLLFSIKAANGIKDRSDAVVIVPKAQLSLTPGRANTEPGDRLEIHEGHKVRITDSITGAAGAWQGVWYEINVGNNVKAWIRSTDVERIADERM